MANAGSTGDNVHPVPFELSNSLTFRVEMQVRILLVLLFRAELRWADTLTAFNFAKRVTLI